MPAWGVRTALTALRSFMAEKGTAGQVGGLEAPADVRRRLAKESRNWKCEACGKSNETVLREWWEVCQSAGVDMKGEEDLGLESLPEGMTLEARDPNAHKSTTSESKSLGESRLAESASEVQSQSSPESNTTASSIPQQQQPHSNPNTPPRSTPQSSASSTLRPPSQSSIHLIPTPSAESAQASAEEFLTPGELAQSTNTSSTSASHARPLLSGFHNGPLAAANAAMGQTPQPLTLQRDRGREQTITIDRAIAGVFLALCLMVLKKIFFPANSSPYSGSMNDFYLQRE